MIDSDDMNKFIVTVLQIVYRHLTNDLSETKTKPTNGLLTDRLNFY